ASRSELLEFFQGLDSPLNPLEIALVMARFNNVPFNRHSIPERFRYEDFVQWYNRRDAVQPGSMAMTTIPTRSGVAMPWATEVERRIRLAFRNITDR
ncbi:unnamed protein product, partial [Symbiodinium sp. KB8]